MDRFLLRSPSPSQMETESSFPEIHPSKKRKLLDKKVEENSNSVKKTLNEYKGAIFEELPEKRSSIFSLLTNEECKTYTNMTLDQFTLFYLEIEPYLIQPFKKGRKSQISIKDACLLYIIRLCTGTTYEILASDFGIKEASTIYRICERIEEPLYQAVKSKFFMKIGKKEQTNLGISCAEFPEVGLIVDSTFQHCFRPNLSFNDAKVFFSGKHGAYGLKKETAHIPDGRIAISFEHSPGSVHDVTLFRSHLATYKVNSIFYFHTKNFVLEFFV